MSYPHPLHYAEVKDYNYTEPDTGTPRNEIELLNANTP